MTEPRTEWQVPTFEKYELSTKRCNYCVCVFVINEGEKLLKQLEKMKTLSNQVDIIVADGGSEDGSTEQKRLESLEVNTLLVKRDSGKLGSQMRMAFAWALKRGYKGVIVIDGNNKDDVSGIPSFVTALESGHDHIQGSRFIPGGHHENTPTSRLLGLKILHVPLMRLAARFKYTDTTNGFRAYSARLLADQRMAVFRDIFVSYELHYYLAIRASRLGFDCKEIPVTRVYPKTGKTPTKISPIKGNFQVIVTLFKAVFGYFDPK